MAHLHKTLTAAAIALMLWLSRQSPLRGTGFGALAVIGAVTWIAYALTRGLRLLVLPGPDLREPAVRRDASWLVGANALLSLGLLVESRRLADPFWWQCALVPGVLALLLLMRVALTHPLHRSPFAGGGRDLGRPASSWPYVSVAATASRAPGTSGAASVSIRF